MTREGEIDGQLGLLYAHPYPFWMGPLSGNPSDRVGAERKESFSRHGQTLCQGAWRIGQTLGLPQGANPGGIRGG